MRLLLALYLISNSLQALEVVWYGHSAFRIKSNQNTVILIDPWISNPVNTSQQLVLNELKTAHYILVSHGHGDALGDSLRILQQTEAKIITTYSLASRLIDILKFPAERIPRELQLDVGGSLFLRPDIQVTAMPALHSNEVMDNEGVVWGAGPAIGWLIHFEGDKKTVYHTGDTGLFSDMQLVKVIRPADIMLVCIGGQFTMGPREAAVATSLVSPQMVIPMRYLTFPSLKGSPEEFKSLLEQSGYKGKSKVLDINKYYEL